MSQNANAYATQQEDDNLDRREEAVLWFKDLRDRICKAFEDLEDQLTGTCWSHLPAGRFERKQWQRTNHDGLDGGGGEMSVMRGRVFEKVGVNISTVHGTFSPEFAGQIPGASENPAFWASGISLVAHMRSPKVPAVHMNTRHIITTKRWFGGGADLTPMQYNEQDRNDFHQAFKEACDPYGEDYYERFKEWCDRYFYLPHREEPRGIGGIFYDYLPADHALDFEHHLQFTKAVGEAFLNIYPQIVSRHLNEEWTDEEREAQLIKRGRYVEFNLLHDRGTTFGLKTGGNTEAILMSMPPEVKWP